VIGPLIAGHIGDRFGFRATLRLLLLIEASAVAVPLVTAAMLLLALSSFVIGALNLGIVAVTIGRMRELLHDPEAQARAWSYCTAAFALGQAAAGYGFSFIFAHANGGYAVLFALGTAAFVLALALDVGVSHRPADRAFDEALSQSEVTH
jgi:predicted MFS family arabinose efflux permease